MQQDVNVLVAWRQRSPADRQSLCWRCPGRAFRTHRGRGLCFRQWPPSAIGLGRLAGIAAAREIESERASW